MLNDIYVHEQLAKVEQRSRPRDDHTLLLARLNRRNSPTRRLARLIGRGLYGLAEQLMAYAADRPRRLSVPVPPIVERYPTQSPFSQN